MDTRQLLKDFGKLLKRNHEEMRSLFEDSGTDCFRVYNWNIESVPWFIDFYGVYLHISSLADERRPVARELEEELLETAARMLYVPQERIYFKRKELQGRKVQHEKQAEEARTLEVHENGLSFLVNLSDYVDTGLFLDHRDSRFFVRQAAPGMRVLNLYCYTGGFTVNAAAGGAARTVSVDLSNTYLRWAEDNMRLNGFEGGPHEYVAADAAGYLAEAEKRGEGPFDLIIVDPPTFSNSRKMEGTFDIQRDHPELLRRCLRLLSPNGAIFFSSNYSSFRFNAKKLKGAQAEETTRQTVPPDFPGKHRPHRSWTIRRRK
jgi:23S rRNA G2069 N7-methylase RlmK/C1962 C5-methylase RlmI